MAETSDSILAIYRACMKDLAKLLGAKELVIPKRARNARCEIHPIDDAGRKGLILDLSYDRPATPGRPMGLIQARFTIAARESVKPAPPERSCRLLIRDNAVQASVTAEATHDTHNRKTMIISTTDNAPLSVPDARNLFAAMEKLFGAYRSQPAAVGFFDRGPGS